MSDFNEPLDNAREFLTFIRQKSWKCSPSKICSHIYGIIIKATLIAEAHQRFTHFTDFEVF